MSKELIRLSDCRMVFDDEVVLNSINLYINDKEFLTLLGPSVRQDDHPAYHRWFSEAYLRGCVFRRCED